MRASVHATVGAFMRSDLPIAGFASIDPTDVEEVIELASQTPYAVTHGVVEGLAARRDGRTAMSARRGPVTCYCAWESLGNQTPAIAQTQGHYEDDVRALTCINATATQRDDRSNLIQQPLTTDRSRREGCQCRSDKPSRCATDAENAPVASSGGSARFPTVAPTPPHRLVAATRSGIAFGERANAI